MSRKQNNKQRANQGEQKLRTCSGEKVVPAKVSPIAAFVLLSLPAVAQPSAAQSTTTPWPLDAGNDAVLSDGDGEEVQARIAVDQIVAPPGAGRIP